MSSAYTASVSAFSSNTRRSPDRRPRVSSTTRSGATTGASSARRAVSCGSSASTVPLPVRMAPARARQDCTSARAAREVIHLDSPLARPVRPSRLIASLTRTQGRPRSMREKKPRLSSRPAACINPVSVSTPAAIELAEALPVHRRERIAAGGDHAGDAGGDQRIGAGRRAAHVRAGFERDVGGGAARLHARLAQRVDFGMGLAGAQVDSPRRRPCPCARSRSRPSGSVWW